jgi:ribonuclease-3
MSISISKEALHAVFAACNIVDIIICDEDIPLYTSAFTHSSLSKNPLHNYERLEWLGDGIVNTSSRVFLFTHYPNESPGFYSQVLGQLVKGKQLAEFARHLHLDQFIQTARYVTVNDRILGDVFEGFIGAVYMSRPENQVNASVIVTHCLKTFVDMKHVILMSVSYKDILLHTFQKTYGSLVHPIYLALDGNKQGIAHPDSPSTLLSDRFGDGIRKIDAQQNAARNVLEDVFGIKFNH